MNRKKDNTYIEIKQSLFLRGVTSVEGAKNSFLPIVMAALLARGISKISNVPPIVDVYSIIELLERYNTKIFYDKKEKEITIDTSSLAPTILSSEHFNTTRSSILLVGAVIKHFQECWVGLPGGDRIGKRPIDIHLDGLAAFGIHSTEYNEYIHFKIDKKIIPTEFFLPFPSVGATQNLLLLAAQLDGCSILRNVAQEPEIFDLIEVLEKMGAKIEYLPGGKFVIYGNSSLKAFSHTLIPDRLEAATLLLSAAITKGSIHIPNAPCYAMHSIIYYLKKLGHSVEIGKNNYGITFSAAEHPRSENISIKTMPYPGFSTDYQALTLALLATTPGKSSIHELVFENRMLHSYELNKMGASIKTEGNIAYIDGISELKGMVVNAYDIRAAATLVLAGLVATGETKIFGVNHLFRGYCNLDKKLQSLGAAIKICYGEQSAYRSKKESNKNITLDELQVQL